MFSDGLFREIWDASRFLRSLLFADADIRFFLKLYAAFEVQKPLGLLLKPLQKNSTQYTYADKIFINKLATSAALHVT